MKNFKREGILPLVLAVVLLLSLAGNLWQAEVNKGYYQADLAGSSVTYEIINDAIIAERDICQLIVKALSGRTVDRDELRYWKGYISGKTDPYEGRQLVLAATRMPWYEEADLSVVVRFYVTDQKLAECLLDLTYEQRKELIPHYEAVAKLLVNNGVDGGLQEMVRSESFDTPEFAEAVREINGHLDAIEVILDRTES